MEVPQKGRQTVCLSSWNSSRLIGWARGVNYQPTAHSKPGDGGTGPRCSPAWARSPGSLGHSPREALCPRAASPAPLLPSGSAATWHHCVFKESELPPHPGSPHHHPGASARVSPRDLGYWKAGQPLVHGVSPGPRTHRLTAGLSERPRKAQAHHPAPD